MRTERDIVPDTHIIEVKSLKCRLVFIVGSILLVSIPPIVTSQPSFHDGSYDTTLELNAPDYFETSGLKIPARFYLASGRMAIAGMPSSNDTSAYPSNITVISNNTVMWTFHGTGFGALGRQDIFSKGDKTLALTYDLGGGSTNVSIRIPSISTISAASFDLGSLAPPDRYCLAKFDGTNNRDLFGASVSGAGDTNNDGYDDLVAGAWGYYSNGSAAGCIKIYLGGPDIDNVPDAIQMGFTGLDYLGHSVAGAGDVNGDGFDDVLAGAYGSDLGIANGGAAFLYFGGQKLNLTPDITFPGLKTPDQLGWSVSGAGDVNNDGFDDIIIGANRGQPVKDSVGAAYIFLGGPSMDNIADVNLSGTAEYDEFGYCVSDAGDVNGDGYDDVIVGAPYNDAGANNAGRAYIYFGGPAMDDVPDIVLTGVAADDNFGWSVSGAGDVNNDGYDDVIVGAPSNNAGGADAGRAYLFLGGPSMDNVPDVLFTGEAAGDQFGSSVTNAGDMNRDGFDDIAITRNREGNESAYVFFGNASMDGIVDFKFVGGGESPQRVSFAGDVNKDGYDDIIVGDQANQATNLPGRAFVYTTHFDNPGGILNSSVSIGAKKLWSKTGYFNGTERAADFSATLNDYLQNAPVSGTDAFGNSYVDVPLTVSAGNDGGLVLSNLSIVYNYNATIPDFSAPVNEYLKDHQGDADSEGNISVPIEIRSESAGRIRLFGLETVRDLPPSLLKPLDTVDFYEDSINVTLLDLYGYFRDDVDADRNLSFSLVSATNSTIVKTWIWSNRYVAVDSLTGDANDNWTGTVEATVACSDRWGQKTESNEFTVRINNVNDPPVILSSPPLIAEPGIDYYYNITAADGDNDKLDFALLQAPENMTIDNRTGNVRWMPRASGKYNVTVSVSDGLAAGTQDFTMTVPNRPPGITSAPPVIASTGVRYSYQVVAVDDNLDALTCRITATGAGISVNMTGWSVDFTPITVGNISVGIGVSDGNSNIYQNFTIQVLQGNRPPEFKSTPVTTAYVEWLYVYNVSASDPELDKLNYSVETGPEGMSVDATSGKVTWTPKSTGNFTCVLLVSDGKNGVARQQFVIQVLDAVKPSVQLTTPYSGEVLKGKTRFSGTVVRGTRDVLLVQARIDGKDWKNATGGYNWNFTMDTKSLKNGMHTFEFRAFDGVEYSDVVSARFKVDNPASNKGFIPMVDVWMLLLVVITSFLAIMMKRRKDA
jgi:hypothetical protein